MKNRYGCPEPPQSPPATPEEIYQAGRATLLHQLTTPAEIHQPELGSVIYRGVGDIAKALALLDGQFIQPGMTGSSKLYVIEHSRGIY